MRINASQVIYNLTFFSSSFLNADYVINKSMQALQQAMFVTLMRELGVKFIKMSVSISKMIEYLLVQEIMRSISICSNVACALTLSDSLNAVQSARHSSVNIACHRHS